MRYGIKQLGGSLFVAAVVFSGYLAISQTITRSSYAESATEAEVAHRKLASVQDLSFAFKEVARALKPTVVSVSSTQVVKLDARSIPQPFLDLFGRRGTPPGFHAIPPQGGRDQKRTGQGTGFIISEDGYILTNHHVVKDADRVTVKLFDDTEYRAEVVGSDPKTDVAVIKIDKSGLHPASLGNSDELDVGQWVLAIGSPFGLTQSITAGIVSAKGRGNVGIVDYENFIQTDAAINPGNSGGPLVNLKGEVIGMNTAIFSQSGGYMGIGFAIPINMASRIEKSLVSEGKVVRGYLGVYIQDLNKGLAESFGLDGARGALIGRVAEDGPAGEAGLVEGDVILRVDDHRVTNSTDLRNFVASIRPGTEVALAVHRKGGEKKIELTIGELPGTAGARAATTKTEKLGMRLGDVDPLTGKSAGGVIVQSVDPLGLADKAGLVPGDRIVSVQGKKVVSISSFSAAIRRHEAKSGVRLKILRKERGFFVYLPLK